jgi:alpha-tubulin suppressor-like RCC1 family protein
MTRRREISAVAAALIAGVALAACGGASTTGSPTTTGSAPNHPVVYTFGVAGTKGKVVQSQHGTPTPIPGIVGTVVQIATSNSTSYALTSSGTVWAWGVGSSGQLGNGSTPIYARTAVEVDFPTGTQITSLPNPMPFDGGLAIDAQGDAWGWGLNADHDLCLPSGVVVRRPAKIPLSDVTLGTGARTHSLFDSNGTVYACGSGSFGELGNGDTTNRSTPTPVVGLPSGTVKALTSSWGGSGALMDDGSYYNWGYNQAGQLGDGSTTDSPAPVHVPLRAGVVQVFQGGSGQKNGQTLAILADNSLWAWGNGKYGQLGTRSTHNSTTPVRITLPDGAQAASVTTGGFASYAIDRTGKLWAWGRNDDGQLGTGGSGPKQLTPISVGISLRQVTSTAQNVAGLSR